MINKCEVRRIKKSSGIMNSWHTSLYIANQLSINSNSLLISLYMSFFLDPLQTSVIISIPITSFSFFAFIFYFSSPLPFSFSLSFFPFSPCSRFTDFPSILLIPATVCPLPNQGNLLAEFPREVIEQTGIPGPGFRGVRRATWPFLQTTVMTPLGPIVSGSAMVKRDAQSQLLESNGPAIGSPCWIHVQRSHGAWKATPPKAWVFTNLLGALCRPLEPIH